LETSSPTLSLAPSFASCKAVLLISFLAEVNVNGCSFVLHDLSETEADHFKSRFDIACPAGKEILLKIRLSAESKTRCVIHVPPQANLTTAQVLNMTAASPEDFTVKPEVENVKVVVEKGEESCLVAPGTYTTGKLTGNTTVTGTTGEGKVPPVKAVPKKFHFATEQEEVTYFGTQGAVAQEFGFDFGKVKCSQMLVEGNPQFLGKTELNLLGAEAAGGKPYEGCEDPKTKATYEVDLNGCVLRMTALRIDNGRFEAGTTVEDCFVGEVIEIDSAACTYKIPEQSGVNKEGLRHITLANVGAGKSREVTATFSLTGMKYEEEGGACKQAAKANGTLTGQMRMLAGERTGMSFLGLWVEPG
jgi:hypothetical protein